MGRDFRNLRVKSRAPSSRFPQTANGLLGLHPSGGDVDEEDVRIVPVGAFVDLIRHLAAVGGPAGDLEHSGHRGDQAPVRS
jgi:hypothetical protein